MYLGILEDWAQGKESVAEAREALPEEDLPPETLVSSLKPHVLKILHLGMYLP